MKFTGKLFLTVIAVVFITATAMAQATRGEIQGKAVDDAGVGMPGVTVTLSSAALQGAQSTVTGADGTYLFPGVAAGRVHGGLQPAGLPGPVAGEHAGQHGFDHQGRRHHDAGLFR